MKRGNTVYTSMFSLLALLLVCGHAIDFTSPTKSAIPATCYNPTGTSCSWYRECLELKHPCNTSDYPYALGFAERFCNLYGKHYAWFSEKAQKWIDGVRKCLQVSLVNLLDVPNIKCEELQKKAFASHTPCYLNPGPSIPSVCELHCGEYLKIFWTIKAAFVGSSSAGPTFKALWHVSKGCGFSWALKTAACSAVSAHSALFRKSLADHRKLIVVMRLHITNASTKIISDEQRDDSFINGVVSALSKMLKWKSKFLDWFAITEQKNKSKPGQWNIILVLADKQSFESSTPGTPHTNLNRIISDLVKASTKKKLMNQVGKEKYRITSVDLCYDVACKISKKLV